MEQDITKVEELNQLGYNLMYNGNPEAALEYFNQAEQEDENYITTYINRGMAYAALSKLDESKNDFLKALKIDKLHLEALSHLSNICYLMHDYVEGITYANTAVELGSENPSLYLNLALAYEELHDDTQAVRNYNKAIQLNPLEGKYYIRKAYNQIRNNKQDEALETLEKLNHYCPDSFESYHYTFLIYMQKGEYEKADTVINAGLELYPGDVALYYDKLRILNVVKEFDEALKLISLLPKLEGFEAEARNIKLEEARIYLQTGRAEEAVKTLVEVTHMEGASDFEAHYLLMNTYLSENQLEKAAATAEIMINADDESTFSRSAYYYLPMCLLKQGKTEAATKKYKEAISKLRLYSLKNPTEMDAYLFRALCHKDMKEYDKALEVLDYASKIMKDYAPISAIRSNIFKDMGRMEDAQREFNLAKERDELLSEVLSQMNN